MPMKDIKTSMMLYQGEQFEADDLERAIKIIHENLYHKDEFENMQ